MEWIASTENNPWHKRDVLSTQPGVEVDLGESVGKGLYGNGCCFSEICIKAIRTLSKEDQKEIFEELFSPEKCGFDFCRLSIGANDFAESWYSYDEVEDDYELKHFSIDRDKKYIIPAIKEALSLSPDMKFFASPWSPPTWMKFPKVCNYGKIVRTPENLRAYAKYFSKFIDEYKKEGIKVDQIHFQNEMFSTQKFPSCVWDADAVEEFLADYLIDEIGDKSEVWLGTLNGPETDDRFIWTRNHQYIGRVMLNEKCRKNIKGASFQWAGKFGITQAHSDYPELNLINSEIECGDGKNTWDYAMYTFETMNHYFKNGIRASVYWNMALDGGVSTWGWYQNSLISVKDKTYKFNPEFYLMKHFSHFARRNAKVIKTKSMFSSNMTCFENEDGKKVVIVMNPYDKEVTLSIGGQNFVLESRSFNSITL